MKKALLSGSSIFFLFLVWWITSAILQNEIILPGPQAVFQAFLGIFTNVKNLEAIGSTILRLLLAMAIALVSGLLLGVVGGLKPVVSQILKPIVTILRTVPVISIVIIVLIVFGFRNTPYVITFLMIFPLLYQAISEGIKNIDPELIDVYKLEDDHFFSGLWNCYLPLIGDQIKTTLLQAAGLGIKVLVMAEYLAQTQNSIGNTLYLEKVNLRFDYVFAWTGVLIIAAVLMEALIDRYSQRKSLGSLVFQKKRQELD
jgi:NitT/TauT family transport system permease protein